MFWWYRKRTLIFYFCVMRRAGGLTPSEVMLFRRNGCCILQINQTGVPILCTVVQHLLPTLIVFFPSSRRSFCATQSLLHITFAAKHNRNQTCLLWETKNQSRNRSKLYYSITRITFFRCRRARLCFFRAWSDCSVVDAVHKCFEGCVVSLAHYDNLNKHDPHFRCLANIKRFLSNMDLTADRIHCLFLFPFYSRGGRSRLLTETVAVYFFFQAVLCFCRNCRIQFFRNSSAFNFDLQLDRAHFGEDFLHQWFTHIFKHTPLLHSLHINLNLAHVTQHVCLQW